MPRKQQQRHYYSPHDVLSLKGAAAQQTLHEGNLFFYKLCEDSFEQWNKLPDRDAGRRTIATSIVEKIQSNGGVFRKVNGTKMKLDDALAKVKDRMRQISKPKQQVNNRVHPHDVVFTTGGANHLYPGNPAFRALVDEYFLEYYPEFRDGTVEYNLNNHLRIYEKTPAQLRILQELMDAVYNKGGCFRSATLKRLDDEEIIQQKIHQRFKDMKKTALRNGGVYIQRNSAEDYVVKRTGVTSTREITTVVKQSKRKRSSKVSKRSRQQSSNDKEDKCCGEEQIRSDKDEAEERHDDDDPAGGYDSMDEHWEEQRRQLEEKRQKQADSREERVKRRQSGPPTPKQPPTKKPRRVSIERSIMKKKARVEIPEETPDMSEYEKLRVQKIKRNFDRLQKLGLA